MKKNAGNAFKGRFAFVSFFPVRAEVEDGQFSCLSPVSGREHLGVPDSGKVLSVLTCRRVVRVWAVGL